MRPLAIIENDAALSTEIRSAVEAAGFAARCFVEGSAAIANLKRHGFSLAIVDLDLRDTDPFAVCSEASRLVPVIALSGDCGEETCVRALESGADDCLRRPFAGRELVARIRNVLRRADGAEGAGELDELSTFVSAMRIRLGDESCDLSRGESEVLAVLLEHAPAPMTVGRLTELLKAKRGTIESRIKSLRRKLGPGRLVSRGAFGYQLNV